MQSPALLDPVQLAHAPSSSSSNEFDSLLDLESTFYQRGLDAGYPHGELHGLFEGRELGRDKAWELWEEIGYAEGTARFWGKVLEKNGKREGRPAQNLDQLLSLVEAFPTSNDSSSLAQPAPSSPTSSDSPSDSSMASPAAAADEVDIPALLSSLRSKYRTLCGSLGVRPRMQVAGAGSKQLEPNGDGLEGVRQASLTV